MDFDSDFLGRDTSADTEADDDHTLAHRASASGDTQLLIRAIKQDPGAIQQKDADGYSPLAHAVLGKHFQALKKLLKMGADVNVQDAQGRTCLSIAAYQGWNDGVVYLLRKGARQDIVDRSGRTPLHAATYDTDTKSLLALMKILSLEDINTGDNERMTALHWATFHNRPEHVRQLLHRGAHPLQVDIDGKTPLHWAAQNGSASCCQILYEQCGDSVTTIDNCGKTALHLAAAAGHAAILQDLARTAPTTCEAWDKDDRTPLHWAAATGHTSCARALLNMGVSPNPFDVDGVTPLEYATNAGHKDCVVLLRDRLGVKSNVNKSKKTEQKKTASGFFKGLFSRKKDVDKKKETPQNETKLPEVFTSKKEQLTGRNSIGISNSDKNSALGGNVKLQLADTSNGGVVSQRVQHVATSREGGSKRRKKPKEPKEKAERDAGVSTPTTVKTLSSWNDNSSYLSGPSEARTTHLSPLSLRPPSISPRISHSPGLESFDSVPKRRQGELSPLRIDKMTKDRFEIPMPENVSRLKDDRPNTQSPIAYLSFNMNGKSVLPDIHTGLTGVANEQVPDQTYSDHRRQERKKKHKKKRREKDETDTEILVASPHDHVTNIYRPQDRGRDGYSTKHEFSYENEEFIDNDKINAEVRRDIGNATDAEREVIKAVTGVQKHELDRISSL